MQLGSIFHKEVYRTCLATDTCILDHSLLEFLTFHSNQVGSGYPDHRPVQATQIIAANGSYLTCIGTLSLTILYGDRVAPCTVFACIHAPLLKIIPDDYRNPIQNALVENPNICTTDGDTQVQQLTDISLLGHIPDTPLIKPVSVIS